MKKLFSLIILLIIGSGLYKNALKTAISGDVIETASANGLTEFVQAVAISDLTDSAKKQGPPAPFTVFVPKNEAFAASGLAKTRDALRPVIKFHVIPGKKLAKTDLKPDRIETIAGSKVEILSADQVKGQNETAKIENSFECSNGFIHVIDKVLTPTKEDPVE